MISMVDQQPNFCNEARVFLRESVADIRDGSHKIAGIVTLIEVGRNGLQQCPFRLPRSRNPTH
jgi:hypothetical protein